MIKRKRVTTPTSTAETANAKSAAKSSSTKLGLMQQLLRRPEGATIMQLSKTLGWQPHSVRGAMAGSLKKQGLKIASTKLDGEERVYRIEE